MTQARPAEWPMLIFFDGACPLCSREVRLYQRRDVHQRMRWIDIAAPGFDAAAYGLDAAKLNRVMHVKMADGRIFTQAAAFQKIWEATPAWWTTLLRGLLKIPGMLAIANLCYRLFAANRYRLTGRCEGGTCKIDPPQRP